MRTKLTPSSQMKSKWDMDADSNEIVGRKGITHLLFLLLLLVLLVTLLLLLRLILLLLLLLLLCCAILG